MSPSLHRAGRLADDAEVGDLAVRLPSTPARSPCRPRAGPSSSPVISRLIEPRGGPSARCCAAAATKAAMRALHVAGAAAVQHAVAHLAAERIGAASAPRRPAPRRYGRRSRDAAPPVPRRANRFSISPKRSRRDGEAEPLQRVRQHSLRAGIGRGDRGAADQRLGERQRIGEVGQSRSNSLIEVFARVCASTVLTMTAQYSDGPGRAVRQRLARQRPGTTTE